MRSEKVTFQNANGEQLAARLELPAHQHPHGYALFAHCFTCNKNLTAVRNIGRGLTLRGFAVLRFDFTGLGESEGDFADTNFSSNIEDLVAAAHFLKANYQAPSILIGHSLGGAAVIRAAHELPEVKAVATIGAPFSPSHVSHLLADGAEEIERTGKATVRIGGRPFTVKQQFLEDIRSQKLEDKIKTLNRALLIMHSPQDMTVEIENAARIYQAAKHPKSYISLDGADHLLSNKQDSRYTGEMIGGWVQRYLDIEESTPLRSDKDVAVRLSDEDVFTAEVNVRQHNLTADEPASIGGNDFGPSPYELVTAGLGACTAMTLQMYARRKKWALEDVIVHLTHYKDHAEDWEELENPDSKIDHFDRIIEIKGDLDDTQRQKLLEIANKCPVHKTLNAPVKINTRLQADQ
jgi:putative redox protein